MAHVFPAEDEKTARHHLGQVRAAHPGATHHAYAYRFCQGSDVFEKCCDDGEPAGSAGLPMLQLMQGRQVADCLVVATRFFGGIKLGLGGLTRAYRRCAALGLTETILKRREPMLHYRLTVEYSSLGPLSRVLQALEGEIIAAEYGARPQLEAKLPARLGKRLEEVFPDTCRGRGKLERQ